MWWQILKTNNRETSNTRMGLWDKAYSKTSTQRMYDDPSTGKIAGGFLNNEGILTVEDWGCGFGGFEKYISKHQSYVGIDGSNSAFASKIVDLEDYTSDADAIHVRHILEHNPNWLIILQNALNSFNKRMVLTLFTPYQNETTIIAKYPNFNKTGVEMVDIGFLRDDIVNEFSGIKWFSVENIKTDTQYGIEHVFFLEKIA